LTDYGLARDAQYRVHLDSIDQLFNAPGPNPFSEKEVNVLGEPALELAMRRAISRGLRPKQVERLTILLPPDQITPELQQQTTAAIRRYAEAKIADNKLDIRMSRMRGLNGLILVTLITLVALAFAFLLVSGPFADADTIVQGLILGSASVFAWVIMWDSLERLLFDWVSPTLENRVLTSLKTVEVLVQPQA
jgi:hypothetical protein